MSKSLRGAGLGGDLANGGGLQKNNLKIERI